jgi:hypothetical protein
VSEPDAQGWWSRSKRLYDFPRLRHWDEWEQLNLDEHARFLGCIEHDRAGATDLIRDERWGWKSTSHFISFTSSMQLNQGRPPAPASGRASLKRGHRGCGSKLAHACYQPLPAPWMMRTEAGEAGAFFDVVFDQARISSGRRCAGR